MKKTDAVDNDVDHCIRAFATQNSHFRSDHAANGTKKLVDAS